jgi:hypothetical protein
LALIVNPSGSAPPTVIAQFVSADPLVLIVGVMVKDWFTVPVTELGEKLIVGAPTFTVRVN